jgi:hypothetical protein
MCASRRSRWRQGLRALALASSAACAACASTPPVCADLDGGLCAVGAEVSDASVDATDAVAPPPIDASGPDAGVRADAGIPVTLPGSWLTR